MNAVRPGPTLLDLYLDLKTTLAFARPRACLPCRQLPSPSAGAAGTARLTASTCAGRAAKPDFEVTRAYHDRQPMRCAF
jgi:hypothetical protein